MFINMLSPPTAQSSTGVHGSCGKEKEPESAEERCETPSSGQDLVSAFMSSEQLWAAQGQASQLSNEERGALQVPFLLEHLLTVDCC